MPLRVTLFEFNYMSDRAMTCKKCVLTATSFYLIDAAVRCRFDGTIILDS